jgi:hypothetical protein
MIRVVIENLLLFLLPTMIYAAWMVFKHYQSESGGPPDHQQIISDAPLLWLFSAGALLVLLTLVAFESSSGGKPGQQYLPPVLKDGRIEPGRIEPGHIE